MALKAHAELIQVTPTHCLRPPTLNVLLCHEKVNIVLAENFACLQNKLINKWTEACQATHNVDFKACSFPVQQNTGHRHPKQF